MRMKLQDLPDIGSWDIRKSTIQGDLMVLNTRNALMDLFRDLKMGELFETLREGTQLYGMVKTMLGEGFVVGYDSEKEEVIYSDYPNDLLTSRTCPVLKDWSPLNEVDCGKELIDMIIQDGYTYHSILNMEQVTKRPLQFIDCMYINQRRIVADTMWYMNLRRLVQSRALSLEERIDPGTMMMLNLSANTINRIAAFRFPIEHHNIPDIPHDKQVIMDVEYTIRMRPAAPVDCMYLSGEEVIVPLTAKLPVLLPFSVTYSVTDRLTPR